MTQSAGCRTSTARGPADHRRNRSTDCRSAHRREGADRREGDAALIGVVTHVDEERTRQRLRELIRRSCRGTRTRGSQSRAACREIRGTVQPPRATTAAVTVCTSGSGAHQVEAAARTPTPAGPVNRRPAQPGRQLQIAAPPDTSMRQDDTTPTPAPDATPCSPAAARRPCTRRRRRPATPTRSQSRTQSRRPPRSPPADAPRPPSPARAPPAQPDRRQSTPDAGPRTAARNGPSTATTGP